MGQTYPARNMFTISSGVFSKALGWKELSSAFGPMLIAIPVIMGIAIWALPKQER